MKNTDKLINALTGEGSLTFAGNLEYASALEKKIPELESQKHEGSTHWFENGSASIANTRVIVNTTGHIIFFNEEGRRFLSTDPEGHPLHEALWVHDDASGETQLAQARMQLDNQQWVGIKPRAKTFQTQIDISSHDGWEKMSLDDLREKAAEAWRVPFSEVKYFYNDEHMIHQGDGKYNIQLTKDALYALHEGSFDKSLFISFMFQVNWAKLDLIPVVELFQSTLPGTGGAVFEFIWGIYNDQSREEALPPLKYRGLPTYPSKEAFNIFSAFFEPKGPEGKDIKRIFMDPMTSHEITWTPQKHAPVRYFSDTQKISLTAQDGYLYKVTAYDDPIIFPYTNCSGVKKPPIEREVRVANQSFTLLEGKLGREIPFNPLWGLRPQTYPTKLQTKYPFNWKWFFNGEPPVVDATKSLYTVPFYPEGAADIDESSLQPMVLDQIFHYMEMAPAMPHRLEKIDKVLIHTFDTVLAGCIDCTKEREYTVLYSDAEFAQKNAQLLWNYAASRDQLSNLEKVSFLPEKDHIAHAYSTQYGLIFKWIPFMYHPDRVACESMLQALTGALQPGGFLYLVGPRPLQGLFEHYGLDTLYNDPVYNMPFFRQHLKMCPENQVNPDLCVFLLEKKMPEEKKDIQPASDQATSTFDGTAPQMRGFRRDN
ncbi:MAG: hypothetical protein HOL15_10460 [Nitrospinaceae bacterium]|nr:hypothetical protein [Nitrospinaceae bacterium]MBT5867527.1 hypothetical protein [Nitrospinaceae bacterium]MBT6347211.1 hypothetical protein [Nitrospina sp.]